MSACKNPAHVFRARITILKALQHEGAVKIDVKVSRNIQGPNQLVASVCYNLLLEMLNPKGANIASGHQKS